MKTWFDYWILFPLFFVVLLPAGLVPYDVISYSARYREWLFNHLLVNNVPASTSHGLVEFWMGATFAQEILVYLLLCLNLMIPISVFLFCLISLKIAVSNWWAKSKFDSEKSKL